MIRPGKTLRLGLIAGAALAGAACTSDPALWEAIALGLDQAAADLEYENAYCYRGPAQGAPVVSQTCCPGDVGYRDFYIPPESSYWRRGGRDRHDRDARRDRSGREPGRHGR